MSRWRHLLFVPPFAAAVYIIYALATQGDYVQTNKMAAARAAIPKHGPCVDRPCDPSVPLPMEAKAPCYTNTSSGITLDPR